MQRLLTKIVDDELIYVASINKNINISTVLPIIKDVINDGINSCKQMLLSTVNKLYETIDLARRSYGKEIY